MIEKEIPLVRGNVKEQIFRLPEDQIIQIVEQANKWADYQKYTSMMHGIAREMKEVPEIPSEVPKDSNALTKVEFPPDGGVLTYMENFDYPYQGYPHYEFVDKIDFIKKTSRAFVSGLYHNLKKHNKLWFLTLLPGMWFSKDLVRSWVYVNYRLIDRFKIKELRYCKFNRELYRAFTNGDEFTNQLRDLMCMIFEMDNAYRFRAQDILSELDQKALKKNPIRELLRLLDLIQTREVHQEVKDTWTLVKYLVRFYLRIDKELLKSITESLLRIDLEKIRLLINDKVYCAPRKDYTFGFQINPSEEDEKIIRSTKLRQDYKEEEGRIKQESTKAHEMVKDKSELEKLDNKYNQLLKDAEMRYKNEL